MQLSKRYNAGLGAREQLAIYLEDYRLEIGEVQCEVADLRTRQCELMTEVQESRATHDQELDEAQLREAQAQQDRNLVARQQQLQGRLREGEVAEEART